MWGFGQIIFQNGCFRHFLIREAQILGKNLVNRHGGFCIVIQVDCVRFLLPHFMHKGLDNHRKMACLSLSCLSGCYNNGKPLNCSSLCLVKQTIQNKILCKLLIYCSTETLLHTVLWKHKTYSEIFNNFESKL